METAILHELIALNNRFYTEHAASFSATRNAPWAGWTRLVEELRAQDWDRKLADGGNTAAVLDLACGNLRFEHFLADAFPSLSIRFDAIDNCADLAGATDEGAPGASIAFRRLDILQTLLDTPEASDLGCNLTPDLAVCFGFMHHVPSGQLRRRVLGALMGTLAPGGMLAVSFWQFMDEPRLAAKALRADALARELPPFSGFSPRGLDEGDHFLGWQEHPGPSRYCHHFSEQEIDALSAWASSGARELARWSADGSSGTLNRYLLLQRS